jgi:hypothetical protein
MGFSSFFVSLEEGFFLKKGREERKKHEMVVLGPQSKGLLLLCWDEEE